MNKKLRAPQGYEAVQTGIVALLDAARAAAARNVNALMTATYWEIVRRIVEFEQGGVERAAYGESLIERLANDLTQRFGRGYSPRILEQMRLFYRGWPIPQTLSAELRPGAIRQGAVGESSAHQTALPDEKLLADELACTRRELEARRRGEPDDKDRT